MLCIGTALLLAVTVWPPGYNWDLIGYVAAAHARTESDPQLVHSRAYATVQRHVPNWAYEQLTGRGGDNPGAA